MDRSERTARASARHGAVHGGAVDSVSAARSGPRWNGQGERRGLPVSADNGDASEIWSGEYWAKKGEVPLWMFRKRQCAPKAGEPAKPVMFFVHGSSVTSRSFDLHVPRKGEYSIMNEFARYGFDCWTMNHKNYGKSGRTSGQFGFASGVEDLKAAAAVLAHETGQNKYHSVGESSLAAANRLFFPTQPGP